MIRSVLSRISRPSVWRRGKAASIKFDFPSLQPHLEKYAKSICPSPLLPKYSPSSIYKNETSSRSWIDFASLQKYFDKHGHTIVPVEFKFSPNEEDVGLRATKLGRHVDQIRTQYRENPEYFTKFEIAKLGELNFILYVKHVHASRVLLALDTYKTVFKIPPDGKFTVPAHFKIPEDGNVWPKCLWGLTLGKAVSRIRRSGYYEKYHEQLRRMGLLTVPDEDVLRDIKQKQHIESLNRDERVSCILLALETYKKLHNIAPDQVFTVPAKFKISEDDVDWPESVRGLALGMIVNNLRNRGEYSEYRQQFIDMGLNLTVIIAAEKVDRILLALKTYKKQHNIAPDQLFTVPAKFKISEDDVAWPESVRGLALGTTVMSVRNAGVYSEYRQQFIDMGLDLSVRRGLLGYDVKSLEGKFLLTLSKYEVELSRVVIALDTYKKLHDIVPDQVFTVPYKFKISEDDVAWPESVRGLALGPIVHSIRNRGDYSEYRQQFIDMGLDLTGIIAAEKVDRILLALKTYRKQHNIAPNQVFTVPTKFKISEDDIDWPESLRGLALGSTVRGIRYKGTFSEYRQKFIDVGLNMTVAIAAEKIDCILLALKTYKKLHNIAPDQVFTVPYQFKISEDDADWPESVRGLALGKTVSNIRNNGYFSEYRQQFIDMGLDLTVTTPAEKVERILLALKTYKKLHNIAPDQVFTIPRRFEISEDDVAWPESVRGLALGSTVSNIRNSDYFSEYRQKFIDVDLDLTVATAAEKLESILLALKTFKKLHNIAPDQVFTVPCKFKISEDDVDWPESVRGLALGKTVNHIRNDGTYSEYRQQFIDMGLDLTVTTPAEKVERILLALKTYKKLHNIAPDQVFTVPCKFKISEDDVAWPESVRGLALGMTVMSVRNKGTFSEYRQQFIDMNLDLSVRRRS